MRTAVTPNASLGHMTAHIGSKLETAGVPREGCKLSSRSGPVGTLWFVRGAEWIAHLHG